MNIENGKIDGDIEIASELNMKGMFTGNVTIKNGGYLMLNGMATKSLYLEQGSVVEISGTVSGNVINNGGKLFITGTIAGEVIEQAGETHIAAGASVG